MKPDIRQKTALIVERDGEYLVGFSVFMRWSNSPYDAWRTRNRSDAAKVADRVGGNLMLFNPVIGQIRKYEGKAYA